MVKYIVLDFGMVLAYPTTGNWHITPKFIELVDINKLNREQLKKAFENNKELLDKKIGNLVKQGISTLILDLRNNKCFE